MITRGGPKKFVFLVVSLTLLSGGSPEPAFASGFVTVNAENPSQEPEIFIVAVDSKGQEIRTPILSSGKAAIPEEAHLEIVNADSQEPIWVEGSVKVIASGGSPMLYLSGDVQVVISDQVGEVRVFSVAGNPTVTIGEETKPLPPGNDMKISNVNNQLNVVVQAPPAEPVQEAATPPAPAGPTDSSPSGVGNEGAEGKKASFALSPEEVSLLKSLSILKPETPRSLPPSSPPPVKKLPRLNLEKKDSSELETVKKLPGPNLEEKDSSELETFLQDVERKVSPSS